MDDRDQPDTNVVNLRRKGDPGEAQRKQVASTIFADEDEIATFSRGNLVPPPADTPDGQDASKPGADPFFDGYHQKHASAPEADRTPDGDAESTAAYFDQISAQSPAQMAEKIGGQPPAAAMPGSAHLPARLPQPTRWRDKLRGRARTRGSIVAIHGHALRFARPLRHDQRGGLARRIRAIQTSTRLAHPGVVTVLVVLLVAGVCGAALIATQALSTSTAPRLALRHSTTDARQKTASNARGGLPIAPAIVPRTRPTRQKAQPRRARPHARTRTHVTLVADHTPANTSSTSPPSVPTSAGQTEPSSVSSQQNTSPPTSSSSGSNSRPAFGANGTLGPGSSPNG